MNRFANLPFQSWELKPQGGNAVSLTLIAAVVVAEFTITVIIPLKEYDAQLQRTVDDEQLDSRAAQNPVTHKHTNMFDQISSPRKVPDSQE